MARGRPRKKAAPKSPAKRRPGRPSKAEGESLLLKSAELIGWALGGIEREISSTRERLSSLTAQANQLRDRMGKLGGGRPVTLPSGEPLPGAPRRRQMSAAARKLISERMKKTWADRKAKLAAAAKAGR
jgi:hypothetical protein